MSEKTKRDDGSWLTALLFCIGCQILIWVVSPSIGFAVLLIGLGAIGELQRKSNQILDALEKSAPADAKKP